MALSITAVPAPVAADAKPCANSGILGTPYKGFGSETRGGAGKPIYRVTNLDDSGPGSLRAALSTGSRCIVFDVAGEIVLKRQIYVRSPFLTMDGFSAPAPGITVRDYGIGIWGTKGAHDVILRGLRFRDPGQKSCAAGNTCFDGIQIKNGAYNVVIDHVSVDNAADGAIDVGNDVSDITIQWSILSGTRKQSLLEGRSFHVSMHHNLFIDGQNRNPQAQWDRTLETTPPSTVLDFRNNVIWNFSAYGTLVRDNATANVVNNYYYSSSRPTASSALHVYSRGRAYADGNVSGNGADVDRRGTDQTEFPAPPVTSTDALTAAYKIRNQAGARGPHFGLDAVDSAYIAEIDFP